MKKRNTSDAGAQYDSSDRPIGLTGAFEPISAPSRHARTGSSYDSPVGLTQAFGPIEVEEEEPVNWDTPDKWKGFDWDAPVDYGYGDAEDGVDGQPDALAAQPAGDPAPADADAPASASAEAAGGVEGSSPADAQAPAAKVSATGAGSASGGRHARHAAHEPEPSERMRQSHKLRRSLVVVIVLLLVVAGIAGYFVWHLLAQGEANTAQQVQEQAEVQKSGESLAADTQDVVETAVKTVDVPNLANVLGMDKEQAMKAIGRGALETGSRDVKDGDRLLQRNVTVSLTDEPMDAKTHAAPTVYLGLDAQGKVIEVGYSASASALGYAYAPFVDAVLNDRVIENTFAEIGIDLPEGSVELPADKEDYTTYAADGTTVTKERCPFVGSIVVDGQDCTWSSVLSYDYTTQMIRGDLTETVRLVYVYVSVNQPEPPAASGDAAQASGDAAAPAGN